MWERELFDSAFELGFFTSINFLFDMESSIPLVIDMEILMILMNPNSCDQEQRSEKNRHSLPAEDYTFSKDDLLVKSDINQSI